MIGPLRDYKDIYVTECGRQFATMSQGRSHEQTCDECQRQEQSNASDEHGEKVVCHATVGLRQVPVLVWPDGTRLHLTPYVIEGGQDPVHQLREWLCAWIEAT